MSCLIDFIISDFINLHPILTALMVISALSLVEVIIILISNGRTK